MQKTLNTGGEKIGFVAYARSVERWLSTLHPLLFVVLMTFTTFVASTITAIIIFILGQAFGSEAGNLVPDTFELTPSLIAYIVIVAPIIETAIFQHAVIRLLNKLHIFSSRKSLLIIISAIPFAIVHRDNIASIINTLLIGIIFSYAYVLKMKHSSEAFWSVTAVHAVRNLISVSLALSLYR